MCLGRLHLAHVSYSFKHACLSEAVRIHALFYHLPGTSPPREPVPQLITAHAKGQASMKKAEEPTTNFADQTFGAMCNLVVIIHEMTSSYYEQTDVPLLDNISFESAESMYQKILAWADVLPESLTRSTHCYDHTVIFQ